MLRFRLTALQHDNLSLKQQLETAHAAVSDRSGVELHDKLYHCFILCYRLTALQHDNLSLKQQLETAHAAVSDRSGVELHDKLNTMMTSLKADHEKVNLC